MAQFDRAAALAAGYTEAEIADYMRQAGVSAAPSSATRAGVQPASRNFNRSWVESGLNAIPPVASAIGGGLGFAGGTVFGTPVAGLPGALEGAAVGGAGGEAARQLLARRLGFDAPDTPGEALGGIAAQAGTGVVSEATGRGLGKLVGMGARSLYRGALRPTLETTRRATSTASRIAGAPVAEDVADLSAQGLRERIPIGRGLTGTGTEKLNAVARRPSLVIAESLEDAGRAGHRIRIQDPVLADEITVLKQELMKETGGPQKVARVDAMWRALIDQFRQPSTRLGKGKLQGLTPEQLQTLKQTWQHQAESVYKAAEKGAVSERQQLQARFNAAVARGARKRLEAIPVPSREAGKTVGQLLAEANERLSSLSPLRGAVQRAETAAVSGRGQPPLVGWNHAGGLAAGGIAGSAVTHNPSGAALGAGAGLLLQKLLEDPVVASRAALFLTNQGTQQTLRQVPRSLLYAYDESFGSGR